MEDDFDLAPEPVRAGSARFLSIALLVQALAGGIQLGALSVASITGPFSLGFLASAATLFAVLSCLAAYLEWNREPLAEAFALAASVGSLITSLAIGLAGLWYTAPILSAASMVNAYPLVERYILRNEARHRPLA